MAGNGHKDGAVPQRFAALFDEAEAASGENITALNRERMAAVALKSAKTVTIERNALRLLPRLRALGVAPVPEVAPVPARSPTKRASRPLTKSDVLELLAAIGWLSAGC